jgi:hypothetical protein
MAKSASACSAQPRNPHDQKTEIRRLQIIFAEEKPEDREAKKSGHIQDKSSRQETRKGRALL